MDQSNTEKSLLERIDRPAFLVREGVVINVNQSAAHRQIQVNTSISDLLQSGTEVYNAYSGGLLQLPLFIHGVAHPVSVERLENADVFLFETDKTNAELQTLSLAAVHLRSPLNGIMPLIELLLSNDLLRSDETTLSLITQVNRGLYQMQRMVCDMSDAGTYSLQDSMRKETVEISHVFYEIMDKAKTLLLEAGINIQFSNLSSPVFCVADPQMLERAVYNLISNAAKYTTKPCTIEAALTRKGNMLYFTVQDNGEAIPYSVRSSVFSRFRREPGIEDGSVGLGLGMTIVRSVAMTHGGAVLIDQPKGKGNRFTMTLAIKQDTSGNIRSPIIHMSDYAGGRDHALLELSDVLPSSCFDPNQF